MSTNRSKDRSALCSFTSADGRQCRTPRRASHPRLCSSHAREGTNIAGSSTREKTMLMFPSEFVMDRVSVDLENCYGIKKLREQFDFSQERVYAIYAPNGAMKSSLASTFLDVANGRSFVSGPSVSATACLLHVRISCKRVLA